MKGGGGRVKGGVYGGVEGGGVVERDNLSLHLPLNKQTIESGAQGSTTATSEAQKKTAD